MSVRGGRFCVAVEASEQVVGELLSVIKSNGSVQRPCGLDQQGRRQKTPDTQHVSIGVYVEYLHLQGPITRIDAGCDDDAYCGRKRVVALSSEHTSRAARGASRIARNELLGIEEACPDLWYNWKSQRAEGKSRPFFWMECSSSQYNM